MAQYLVRFADGSTATIDEATLNQIYAAFGPGYIVSATLIEESQQHWHQIGTAVRRVIAVISPAMVEEHWHKIGNSVRTVITATTPVVEEHWHKIGDSIRIVLTATKTMQERWHKIGTGVRMVIARGAAAEVPEEEEEKGEEEKGKFPVGALLAAGGVALVLASISKKK